MNSRILLIDDDRNRRDSVRIILNSNKQLLTEAVDCAESLHLLAKEKFDLILLDITLPDKSGFRVLEYLEKNQIASKVMVLTGRVGVANVIRNATHGAREYMTKPFDSHDLLKSIGHILSEQAHSRLKLQIIRAGDFIISTPAGALDLKISREGLEQIATTGTDLLHYTVMIDLRDVKSSLSTTDIYELACELINYGKTFRRKTAVLVRADKDIDQAMYFQDLAQNRGFSVKTFTVFEEAIIWLSSVLQLSENK